MMAIEGFVLEHWEQLNALQNKKDYDQVSEQFIGRMARITNNNKNRLIKEVQKNDDLIALLKKANSSELTEAEKGRLQELLITVLKTIPTFVIISLPHRFLTLPILFKILPKNFFAESLSD